MFINLLNLILSEKFLLQIIILIKEEAQQESLPFLRREYII